MAYCFILLPGAGTKAFKELKGLCYTAIHITNLPRSNSVRLYLIHYYMAQILLITQCSGLLPFTLLTYPVCFSALVIMEWLLIVCYRYRIFTISLKERIAETKRMTLLFRPCIKMLLELGMGTSDERNIEWTGGWGRNREEKRKEDRRKGGGEVVFWTLRHEPGNPIIQCLNRIGTSLLLETTHSHTDSLFCREKLWVWQHLTDLRY